MTTSMKIHSMVNDLTNKHLVNIVQPQNQSTNNTNQSSSSQLQQQIPSSLMKQHQNYHLSQRPHSMSQTQNTTLTTHSEPHTDQISSIGFKESYEALKQPTNFAYQYQNNVKKRMLVHFDKHIKLSKQQQLQQQQQQQQKQLPFKSDDEQLFHPRKQHRSKMMTQEYEKDEKQLPQQQSGNNGQPQSQQCSSTERPISTSGKLDIHSILFRRAQIIQEDFLYSNRRNNYFGLLTQTNEAAITAALLNKISPKNSKKSSAFSDSYNYLSTHQTLADALRLSTYKSPKETITVGAAAAAAPAPTFSRNPSLHSSTRGSRTALNSQTETVQKEYSSTQNTMHNIDIQSIRDTPSCSRRESSLHENAGLASERPSSTNQFYNDKPVSQSQLQYPSKSSSSQQPQKYRKIRSTTLTTQQWGRSTSSASSRLKPTKPNEKPASSSSQKSPAKKRYAVPLTALITTAPMNGLSPPEVSSKGWALLSCSSDDSTHTSKQQLPVLMLAGKNAAFPVEVASLTKIMTCYLTIIFFESHKLDLHKVYFEVSSDATDTIGTSANLVKGDFVSAYELLFGLMLPSGNDAAVVLSEGVGYLLLRLENGQQFALTTLIDDIAAVNGRMKKDVGGLSACASAFLKEMNRVARDIGMEKTFYACAHGLPNRNNVSSAKDIGILSCIAMQHGLFAQVVNTQEYDSKYVLDSTISYEDQYEWENTNFMLEKNGYDGVKTGVTETAGPCLSTSYKTCRNGKNIRIVCVLLNCKSMDYRWVETKDLVQWGLKHFHPQDE